MVPTPPLVQGEQLTYQQDGQSTQVTVGSAEWFRWLETASTFTYRTEHGTFTARLERAGNKRGGTYWRAYRKRAGKLRRAYLGKSVELTLERLQTVAALLARQGPAEDMTLDNAHEPGAAPLQSIEEPQDRKPGALPTLTILSTAPPESAHKPSSGHDLPTGTTTLLFSDIEGSTRLLQQLGQQYAEVLPTCRRLLRTVFLQHKGHEVDTQGDSFFVAFARAADAISAAVAAQRVLFTHIWPEGVAVRVRMGLHTGEPQLLSEGYVGLDVHQAARIASAGHGGQVLLSQTTRELVERAMPPGVSLRDLGEYRLKDLPHPTHLYQLVIEGVAAEFPSLRTVEPNNQRDPLLATKLHQPRPRSRLVSRPRLVERLQQSIEHALTLVSAPAGFGKTTLLAQWLAESGMPTAWLSLEPEDNDPVRFLTYLIAALQTVDAHLGTAALELLQTPQPPPQAVMALLTNDLMHHATRDFVLLLDDYHIITAEPIHLALAFLLDHLPPHLHLVLATRADPPLPLARLRARGQLNEVRAEDLRLSSSETETFLQKIMGLELSSDTVATLERRTEGWVAGLQLAALSLRGSTDISAFLIAFTGSHRFILDYLSEEVLSRQPIAVQSFLLHTSVLDRLSASLCDAVTGKPGSQEMLEALERTNLFVIALDNERRWYRYHHLFAELLKGRLQHVQPNVISELHSRASSWYQEHGLINEAVHHALVASDFERAAHLIEAYGLTIALTGQVQLVLGWLNALPDTLVRTRPFLALNHADLLMYTQQFDLAEARLRDAERWIEPGSSVDTVQTIQGRVSHTRALIASMFGDHVRALSLARQALDLLPEEEHIWRASARLHLAYAYRLSGDVTPANEQLIKGIVEPALVSGNIFMKLTACNVLGRLQVMQGRLKKAAATYKQMTLEEAILHILASAAPRFFGLGEILREWNELNAAEECLAGGMRLITGPLLLSAEEVTYGYLALALLQLARGKYSAALATLEAFVSLARQRHFVSHLIERGAAMLARVELVQGNLALALHWSNGSGLSIEDELGYPREQEYLTLARVRIAQGREDPAGPFLPDALYLLDRLLADAEAKARMRSVLEILTLQALALHAQRDRQAALVVLERALMLAEPEGYIRLFVDEGAPMLALLQQASRRGIMPTYVAKLLAAFTRTDDALAPRPVSQAGSLIEPLTEREREVLRLLLEGASNREIARRLVLSINTVKRHVYNLCGKLGVQSRTQAIAKARALNLL